jgi:hypothetical protein
MEQKAQAFPSRKVGAFLSVLDDFLGNVTKAVRR